FSKNGRSSESGDASPGAGQSSGPARSWFSLVVVLALIGLWSSMAVVYFDVVDYDSVLARAKEFRQNFTNVLQGKLSAYDSDGDGDFDLEDAKVLLGLNKDGSSEGNAESSLEEVISVLSDEGSDWLFGFFSFLIDVVTTADDKTQGKDQSLPDDKEPIRSEQGNDQSQENRAKD
uniref:Aspartyl beta-hydroxylase/Triadin domain-containing protein n=1 Tax=Periophthalmus magnuspinnatus TaxID=409849 RepID=A0A3B4A2V5_9GOBI